jgi:hypothetical protein
MTDEASEGARLENSGAYAGALAHRKTMKPPSSSAAVPITATTFWPGVNCRKVVVWRFIDRWSISRIRPASA